MLYEIEVFNKEFEVWESWWTTRDLEYAGEISKVLVNEFSEEMVRIRQIKLEELNAIPD